MDRRKGKRNKKQLKFVKILKKTICVLTIDYNKWYIKLCLKELLVKFHMGD